MIPANMEDWLVLLGRTHPLIVHLPIGMMFFALLLEVLCFFRRYDNLRPALVFVWGCCALTATMASVAGLVLSGEGGFEEDILVIHQWLGIAVAVMAIVLFMVSVLMKNRNRHLSPVLAILSFLVLSAAGHFGGTLTHGEDYFETALFSALGWSESDSVAIKQRQPIADVNEALVYADLVEPVLEAKCYRCHNHKKQKGKLRLDEYHFILAGGKSGSTLVPGNPSESELYNRLLLPEGDKKRMPPKGKNQLTEEEIAMIHWWIKDAKAAPDRKVREIRKTPGIDAVLAAFTSPKEFVSEMDKEIPAVDVGDAPEELLKPLLDAGLVVSKFSSDLPFLTVNCVNAGNFNDEHARMLLPLKDHVIWLKAGHTQLTDEGLKTIAQLRRLTRLSLEFNAVSDEGVRSLRDLAELRYLNLVGTKVTKLSADHIAACRRLKVVYLWKTGFSRADQNALRQRLPDVEINFGEE